MRRYLWNDKEDQTLPTLDYDGDAPNGSGCFVRCPHCNTSFNEAEREVCPGCQADLVFPRADW